MNYAFLPDLSALTILIFILLVLRRRHPQEQADIWLLGLFFTLAEAITHTFYAPVGIPAKALHVIVVDCYLLSGLAFIWASGDHRPPHPSRFLYVALNALPLLALNTVYGLNIRTEGPYIPAVVAGLIIGPATTLYLRNNWRKAVLFLCGWMAIAFLVHSGNFREAVYWSLSAVYALAAINIHHRLPRQSTGRLALLTGFIIWSLCLLLHPWIGGYPAYADIASHVWNMQKSLISIGMILVMLEEQVSSNEWLALHDELTGLPNRRLFADRLSHAIERSRRTKTGLALLMVDLDGFKKINDSLGHYAGDQVLREVSLNLRKSVRASDTLARLGGDEFIIVATDLIENDAIHQFVNNIRSAVERPIHIDGQAMIVSASLGIARFPEDGDDAIKLVRIADQRMYTVKNGSNNPQLDATPGLATHPALQPEGLRTS